MACCTDGAPLFLTACLMCKGHRRSRDMMLLWQPQAAIGSHACWLVHGG